MRTFLSIFKKLAVILVIYIAFISLGFPDGILGVSWPGIRSDMKLPLDYIGSITTAMFCMSAISSVVCTRLINKFGAGAVTFVSALLVGIALIGTSKSPNLAFVVLFAMPLGFGQGAIDTSINTYVSEHYTARHMNWLHCFWGIGASVGPVIMTRCLADGNNWRKGYGIISIFESVSCTVLLISLLMRLWEKESHIKTEESGINGVDGIGLYSKRSQILSVALFFIYSGIEYSTGLLINSVLLGTRNMKIETAGLSSTIFYFTIMLGRFITGMFVNKTGSMNFLRYGLLISAAGCGISAISQSILGTFAGIALIGLGFSPIYPCLMHQTPARFKKSVSDRLIGYQVGAAWIGGSIISSGISVLIAKTSLQMLFPSLILLTGISFIINEYLNVKSKTAHSEIEQRG